MVTQLLEDGDLAHGSRGDALVIFLYFDLLDGHKLVGVDVLALVDRAVGALADLLELLLVLHDVGTHRASLFGGMACCCL